MTDRPTTSGSSSRTRRSTVRPHRPLHEDEIGDRHLVMPADVAGKRGQRPVRHAHASAPACARTSPAWRAEERAWTAPHRKDTPTMPIRALVLLLAVFIQELPPPFHSPWFRKGTRVVAMPDGHQLTVPAGFTVNLFADELQFARFMALAPNGDVFLAEPVRGDGTDHDPARRATGTASPRRARSLRPDSIGRSGSPSGRTICMSATTIRWCDSPTRRARPRPARRREDRGSAGERCRARSGHRESPEDRHQPDARLQPLDAERHLQPGRHEAVRHRGIGHQCHARDRRPARRHQRIQPGWERASRVCRRAAQSGGPRVSFPERTRSGRRSTSAITSATISCRISSRRSATAASTAGRTPTSASMWIRR